MPKEEDIRDLTPEFLTAIRRKLNPFSKEKKDFSKAIKKKDFNKDIIPAIEKLGKYQDEEGEKFKIVRTVPGDNSAFLSAVEYKDNMLYFWTNENSELYAIKYAINDAKKDDNEKNITINFSSLTEAVEFLGDWVAEIAPNIADKMEKECKTETQEKISSHSLKPT